MLAGYADFHLIIDRSRDRYSARVTTSPVGQATAEFTLPFSQEEQQRFSWRAQHSLRHVALITPQPTVTAPLGLQEFGTRLFDAVFAGSVGQLFFRSLDAAARDDLILRIRLQFDDVPEVAELPWEFLYSRDLGRFLVLSTSTALVRYLALAQPERALAVTLPLRILVIVSDPTDLPRLAVEQEWTQLQEALGDLVAQGQVVLERLPQATLADLRQWLRREQVNILHFMGHGAFDAQTNQGTLFFENDAHQHAVVTSEQLATLLHDHEPLRLVFLNACQGASGGSQENFAGVAQKLVQQGVPALVAMQFAVSDRSAIALSREFYQSITVGLPLESAVSEARKALYSEGEAFEWGTPVLFSRSPDGLILDDVVTGAVGKEAGKGARNIVIGKNNIQINIGGQLMTLPIWLVAMALLAIVLLLSAPWIEPILNPTQMRGGMNIAITDFGQKDASGRIHRSALGSGLSKTVFDKLITEYQDVYPELIGRDGRSVEIWHDSLGTEVKNVRLGLLDGTTPEKRAEQASRLAERINAHVIIYGYLVEEGNLNSLHLDFYYAGETLRGEPDTVAGRHVLSELLSFPVALEDEPMAVQELLNEPLGLRARVLFWVTVALIFDVTDQQQRALETLQEAKRTLAQWNDREGQALLHYFIGREAFWLRQYDVAIEALEQAKGFKENYANAYIGLGAVHYDRAQLFYTPDPIPEELADCISTEHLESAAQSAEEATQEVDAAIEDLQEAVAIAPDSPWPPIEFPARLALGQAYRLKGQVHLLAGELDEASPWFEKSLEEFALAEAAFAEAEQEQYLAWTHLGRAATFQLQAYTTFATITPVDDPVTASRKQQAAAALFQQAVEECERCLDAGKDVADLVYQRQVLGCGCEYLQGMAQAARTELEKLIEEQ